MMFNVFDRSLFEIWPHLTVKDVIVKSEVKQVKNTDCALLHESEKCKENI